MRVKKLWIEKNVYFHPDTETYSVIIRKNKRSVQKRFKRLEKAREWKETIFRQIPTGIVQFDSVNGFTVWDIENRFMERHSVERKRKNPLMPKDEGEAENYDAVYSENIRVDDIIF